eukprot:EG_transcript_129
MAPGPMTPQASLNQPYMFTRLDVNPTPGESSDVYEDIEESLLAIQRQLDLLTAAREKKESRRAREGEPDPHDPMDLLLAHGLRALLNKVVVLHGAHKFLNMVVKFEQLMFKARTFEGTNVIATNGNQLMQLLTFWKRHKTQEKRILNGVTGSFRPSRTCLVLGPPRSGKSTLLKAIAGQLQETRRAKLQGVVEYAGERLRDKPQPKDSLKLVKVVSYVPQVDEHIPTLTVHETVHFARACVSQLSPAAIAKEGFDEKARREMLFLDALYVELILSLLGIRHVKHTIVGNEVLRGISGGQRKRLTTAECLATFCPVLLMDEISTGLDSATTFEICTALKTIARCLKKTIVVSLLQPTPETYSTFDEILVMAAGAIAYQGATHAVLPYFMELGFECPAGKTPAEFLQEVTLPPGMERYRSADISPRVLVRHPEDFGPAWLSSRQFQQRQQEDVALIDQSKYELSCLPCNTAMHERLTQEYSQSTLRSTLLCLKRQAMLTVHNRGMTFGQATHVLVGSLLLGSLYFQIRLDDYATKFAALFFTMPFVSVSSLAMIPRVVQERQVVCRQTAAHFFPPLAYSIASNLVDIPLVILETLLLVATLYWMVGLSPNAADFFACALTVFLVKLDMVAFFRVLAGLSPNAAVAHAIASLWVITFLLLCGYFLAYQDLKKYWLGVYWVNPMQYGFTGLSLIEFHSARYAVLRNASDPSLGTWGDFYLQVKGMPQDDNRVWLGWLFNAGFYLLMQVLNFVVVSFVRFPPKFPPQPPLPSHTTQLHDAEPMPFTPYTLAWKAINYDVDIPGKKGKEAKLGLRLLENVSGFAKPGTMTALMGSSGAGKTTLLDVLAGRKNTGRVEGDILLNGQKADPITFSRVAGYVEQMDIHSPSATVSEALRFSAFLRLPRELPDAEKEAYVWQVIAMLNLQQVAHSAIGTKADGLSVEQVKRVTIGVEMAANPAVLFLDEPTSGLDSMAADVVMDALKAVAASGRTLICTIHQPSLYLFNMFAHLLLLTRGGKTVFFGETGAKSVHLVNYFNSIPGAPQHDGEQNPATWMLGTAFFPKAGVLTLRNTGMIQSRISQVIFGGVLIGSLYFQISLDDYNSKFAVLYWAMLFVSVTGFSTIPNIIAERNVIYRQTASHFFHPLPYSIASNLVDIPLSILETVIFISIMYWMCGLSPDVIDFFSFMLTVFLVALCINGLFRVLAGLSPQTAAAQGLASILVVLFVLYSGFFVSYTDAKKYYIWVYWINPLQYGMTTLSLIEFHSSRYNVLRNATDPSLGTLGDFYLSVKQLPQEDNRKWLGWIFNICFYILMVLFNSVFLSYVRFPPKHPAQPPMPTEGLKLNDAEPIAFTPYTLAWKAINYDVDIPGKKGKEAKLGLRLLENVSGFAKPGTMTALMGSSGAGKTTLLDVLAGRKTTGRVTGDILLNGQEAVMFSRVAGYVEQMDIHSPSATVAEALRFSAFLRLPRETPDADKEAFVWQVITMLNLQEIAYSAIGIKNDGLSVEQVKRVTIGVEMAANPAVLFLDEPTSGLDSMAADVVMDALKAVAASGRTLICTIHQPSSYLFGMFGHLLLLTGGKAAFFGETGSGAATAVAYFNAIAGVPQHDGEQNPATWMLNVLATEGVKFDEEYRNSQLCARNEEELAVAMEVTGEQLTAGHLYQTPWWRQFRLLTAKWARIHWRTPGYNLARFFACIVVGLLLGSMVCQDRMDTQQAVFASAGVQFIALMFTGVLFGNTVQGLVASERTVFYRERAARMYHPLLANLAMGLTELPYITWNCAVMTCIFYWMAGLNPDPVAFFSWFLVFWLYVGYFTCLGLFLGCLLPTQELATVVVSTTNLFGSLLCGFMLPKDSIPWWWRWLYYLNPTMYAVQAILSSQFYCNSDQSNNCPMFTQHTISGDSQVVAVWGYVQDAFDLNYEDRWLYVGLLVVFI